MQIHGLQKMTLLDFPGKVACTVFLGGCDFRCPFCHNWELVDGSYPPVITEEELLKFLSGRVGLLDGVAVTGGEPLLRRDLPELLRKIRALGFAIKLDTNGNHPELLENILREGLADYVAMDVKNSPARYGETIGIPGFDLTNVKKSVELLMQGNVDYEFRTTVIDRFHTKEDILELAKWIAGAKRYFLQPFADRDTVPTEGLAAPDENTLADWLAAIKPYLPNAEIRGA